MPDFQNKLMAGSKTTTRVNAERLRQSKQDPVGTHSPWTDKIARYLPRHIPSLVQEVERDFTSCLERGISELKHLSDNNCKNEQVVLNSCFTMESN